MADSRSMPLTMNGVTQVQMTGGAAVLSFTPERSQAYLYKIPTSQEAHISTYVQMADGTHVSGGGSITTSREVYKFTNVLQPGVEYELWLVPRTEEGKNAVVPVGFYSHLKEEAPQMIPPVEGSITAETNHGEVQFYSINIGNPGRYKFVYKGTNPSEISMVLYNDRLESTSIFGSGASSTNYYAEFDIKDPGSYYLGVNVRPNNPGKDFDYQILYYKKGSESQTLAQNTETKVHIDNYSPKIEFTPSKTQSYLLTLPAAKKDYFATPYLQNTQNQEMDFFVKSGVCEESYDMLSPVLQAGATYQLVLPLETEQQGILQDIVSIGFYDNLQGQALEMTDPQDGSFSVETNDAQLHFYKTTIQNTGKYEFVCKSDYYQQLSLDVYDENLQKINSSSFGSSSSGKYCYADYDLTSGNYYIGVNVKEKNMGKTIDYQLSMTQKGGDKPVVPELTLKLNEDTKIQGYSTDILFTVPEKRSYMIKMPTSQRRDINVPYIIPKGDYSEVIFFAREEETQDTTYMFTDQLEPGISYELILQPKAGAGDDEEFSIGLYDNLKKEALEMTNPQNGKLTVPSNYKGLQLYVMSVSKAGEYIITYKGTNHKNLNISIYDEKLEAIDSVGARYADSPKYDVTCELVPGNYYIWMSFESGRSYEYELSFKRDGDLGPNPDPNPDYEPDYELKLNEVTEVQTSRDGMVASIHFTPSKTQGYCVKIPTSARKKLYVPYFGKAEDNSMVPFGREFTTTKDFYMFTSVLQAGETYRLFMSPMSEADEEMKISVGIYDSLGAEAPVMTNPQKGSITATSGETELKFYQINIPENGLYNLTLKVNQAKGAKLHLLDENMQFINWATSGIYENGTYEATFELEKGKYFTGIELPAGNQGTRVDYELSLEDLGDKVIVQYIRQLALKVGESAAIQITYIPESAKPSYFIWKSLNPSVAQVDSNGKVTAKAAGTTEIHFTTPDGKKTYKVTVTVTNPGGGGNNPGEDNHNPGGTDTQNPGGGDANKPGEDTNKPVQNPRPAVGERHTVGRLKYQVLRSSSNESANAVAVIGAVSKNEKKITVPDTISIRGYVFKVTKIGNNAFQNYKKLKEVSIGRYVEEIGKNAFSGCSKLKDISIMSKSLKKVGKNALKGTYKKAKISFRAELEKKYKKILKKKGQSKSVAYGYIVPPKGDRYTSGRLSYIITKSSAKKGTVSVAGVDKRNVKSVTIPEKVKLGGYTFKVTGIADKAFENCKKLKKISVDTKGLKKVGKYALKGIHKKCTIEVPSSKYKTYKKLFKNKGQSKTVKIKK